MKAHLSLSQIRKTQQIISCALLLKKKCAFNNKFIFDFVHKSPQHIRWQQKYTLHIKFKPYHPHIYRQSIYKALTTTCWTLVLWENHNATNEGWARDHFLLSDAKLIISYKMFFSINYKVHITLYKDNDFSHNQSGWLLTKAAYYS